MVCAAPSYPLSKKIAVTDRRCIFTIAHTLPSHEQISGYGPDCKWVCECTCILQYSVLKSIVHYTLLCMHSSFFIEKHWTLIGYLSNITEFSLKFGGQMHYWFSPPHYFLWGKRPWPPGPLVADAMIQRERMTCSTPS